MRSGRASVFSVAGATVDGNLRLGRTSGATGNYTTRKEQTHAYNASCFSKAFPPGVCRRHPEWWRSSWPRLESTSSWRESRTRSPDWFA